MQERKNHCVMVPTGLGAATRAGCRCCGLTAGFRNECEHAITAGYQSHKAWRTGRYTIESRVHVTMLVPFALD